MKKSLILIAGLLCAGSSVQAVSTVLEIDVSPDVVAAGIGAVGLVALHGDLKPFRFFISNSGEFMHTTRDSKIMPIAAKLAGATEVTNTAKMAILVGSGLGMYLTYKITKFAAENTTYKDIKSAGSQVVRVAFMAAIGRSVLNFLKKIPL